MPREASGSFVRIWAVSIVLIGLFCVVLARRVPAEEAKLPIKELSADYQKGWCAGWDAAVNAVISRRNLWHQNLAAISPPDKWPEQMKQVLTGVDAFILLQNITSKVTLADGSTIDCAARQ